jgi:hypothetical protein
VGEAVKEGVSDCELLKDGNIVGRKVRRFVGFVVGALVGFFVGIPVKALVGFLGRE